MTILDEILQLDSTWQRLLLSSALKECVEALSAQVESLRAKEYSIYPPSGSVLHALRLCHRPGDVKVVILGQDPYAQPGRAMGLSFSVPMGVALPGSLRNIFLELQHEFGGSIRTRGDLEDWATQGVLLLNSILTVQATEGGGGGMSHAGLGWQRVTDAVIALVSQESPACAFLLWGRAAQSKRGLIDGKRHLILESAHPSPLSAHRGFMGCDHFRQANQFLLQRGLKPIVWI